MRIILIYLILTSITFSAFSQEAKDSKIASQVQSYHYAYISIEGKIFSKKLKVEVDFGDTPEQMKTGSDFSKILTNKKSYAAVLNYMVENEFELVQTLDLTANYSGSGGTYGIIFIMRKKK